MHICPAKSEADIFLGHHAVGERRLFPVFIIVRTRPFSISGTHSHRDIAGISHDIRVGCVRDSSSSKHAETSCRGRVTAFATGERHRLTSFTVHDPALMSGSSTSRDCYDVSLLYCHPSPVYEFNLRRRFVLVTFEAFASDMVLHSALARASPCLTLRSG